MDKKSNTARDARDMLLAKAPEVIDAYINLALLGDPLGTFPGDPDALKNVFNKIVPMIKVEDDVFSLPAAAGRTVEERINDVIDAVGAGDLPMREGVQMLDLLAASIDAHTAAKLRTRLVSVDPARNPNGTTQPRKIRSLQH